MALTETVRAAVSGLDAGTALHAGRHYQISCALDCDGHGRIEQTAPQRLRSDPTVRIAGMDTLVNTGATGEDEA
jgi:hypothetical protein